MAGREALIRLLLDDGDLKRKVREDDELIAKIGTTARSAARDFDEIVTSVRRTDQATRDYARTMTELSGSRTRLDALERAWRETERGTEAATRAAREYAQELRRVVQAAERVQAAEGRFGGGGFGRGFRDNLAGATPFAAGVGFGAGSLAAGAVIGGAYALGNQLGEGVDVYRGQAAARLQLATAARLAGRDPTEELRQSAQLRREFGLTQQGAGELSSAALRAARLSGRSDEDTLIRAAATLSLATGRPLGTAGESLQRVVRGEDEGLEAFGLQNQTAYQKYAEALGTTASKLTENQKLQARLNLLVEEYGIVSAKAGDIAGQRLDSNIGRLDKTINRLTDIKGRLGELALLTAEKTGALTLAEAGVAAVEAGITRTRSTPLMPVLALLGGLFGSPAAKAPAATLPTSPQPAGSLDPFGSLLGLSGAGGALGALDAFAKAADKADAAEKERLQTLRQSQAEYDSLTQKIKAAGEAQVDSIRRQSDLRAGIAELDRGDDGSRTGALRRDRGTTRGRELEDLQYRILGRPRPGKPESPEDRLFNDAFGLTPGVDRREAQSRLLAAAERGEIDPATLSGDRKALLFNVAGQRGAEATNAPLTAEDRRLQRVAGVYAGVHAASGASGVPLHVTSDGRTPALRGGYDEGGLALAYAVDTAGGEFVSLSSTTALMTPEEKKKFEEKKAEREAAKAKADKDLINELRGVDPQRLRRLGLDDDLRAAQQRELAREQQREKDEKKRADDLQKTLDDLKVVLDGLKKNGFKAKLEISSDRSVTSVAVTDGTVNLGGNLSVD